MILSTKFLGIDFINPIITASGILGVSADGMIEVIKQGAGGVTSKSVTIKARAGHKNPTVLGLGKEIGVINAVGLSGEGINLANQEYIRFKNKQPNIPLIASVFAGTFAEFIEVAKMANNTVADLIEVNISCPNVENEFGIPFASDVVSAQKITNIFKQYCHKKIIIKLSPNVPNIAKIAQAVEEAGADAICAINTLGPGLLIDPYMRKAILANKVGGISGPAIKPIALKCVWEIAKNVKIPIIGVGGITTGQDAIEMIMVGATLVGVGSAVYSRGIEVFGKIIKEINDFMHNENISSLEEIRGIIK